mgnify:FL=1|nr:MAG TPA: hypothetical protein [Caudoviricetes sp.]
MKTLLEIVPDATGYMIEHAVSYKQLDDKGKIILSLRRKDTSSEWKDTTAIEREKMEAVAAQERSIKEARYALIKAKEALDAMDADDYFDEDDKIYT